MSPSLVDHFGQYRARVLAQLAQALGRTLESVEAQAEAERQIVALERDLTARPGAPLAAFAALGERLTSFGLTDEEALGLMRAVLPRDTGANGGVERRNWSNALSPILDFVPTAMAFVDTDQRVRAGNQPFFEVVRAPREAVVGAPLGELLTAHNGQPMRIEDAPAGAPGYSLQLARVRPARDPEAELLCSRVPFNPDGRSAGWFFTFATRPRESLAEVTLSERLEQEMRQKEKFAALLTVSRAVIDTLDLNHLLGIIAREARHVIQADECVVFLFDPAEGLLKPVVCEQEKYVEETMAIRLRPGEGFTGRVFEQGRGEIFNDVINDPRGYQIPGTPVENTVVLAVPLETRDEVIGVVTLVRTSDRLFHTPDLELATLIAGHCSAAIVNARLYADSRDAYEELRRTQAQLVQSAKLNALGEMAGGVAHDFNNILAAILGRAQLLLQNTEEPGARAQLAVIEQAALDGAQTVRRVQEFTRVRADERFETIDVNQVLLGVIELTRPAWEAGAKRRGLTMNVHLDLHATLPTAGNASELREVFTNLVLNAVDAMPWGGDLWIATENGPGVVRISIRDTGVGMDAETRARVFDPFFTTKDTKGTGLGLSVAYGIVSRHHGLIEVDSELGKGTTFALEFPVGEGSHAQQSPGVQGPPSRLRVLVVDDEEAVLDVLADLLRMLGQDVTTALGGQAGADRVANERFDVVFSDLGMPDLNGWDLALAVKSRSPETRVVLVTGWGSQLEEEAALARGVDLVVSKPFSLEDIEVALRRFAASRSATSAA